MAARSSKRTPRAAVRRRKPRATPEPSPAAPSSRFPIVTLGASAGGLEAFDIFFKRMPSDTGIGFVLVPHLHARHNSAMTELLQRDTAMKVVEITDAMPVLPDRVHIIPPNARLTIHDGRFSVVSPRNEPMTIDEFLKSLAADQGENAIAVILSGTGSDGALGVKAIKERGGVALAQTGPSLRYDSMPHSAVATGLVDFELPVEEIPSKLVEYAKHLRRVHDGREADDFRQEAHRHLPKIYTLLRARTGHDFSRYKDSTFLRRLQRRMQIVQIAEAAAYVSLLRKDPREVDLLFRELLIGVTHFFRDPRAFEALEKEVIAKLVAGTRGDNNIRAWVPGCSTGEEAYSIAILLRERLSRSPSPPKVQIFGTDIDDHALEIARAGRYAGAIAQDLSPERLERFFIRDGSGYRVVKEIREMCIFSVHNVISDAPFSPLDLISCRNLLIYLDQALQNRVIPLFHFALQQGGYLFLGPSENVTQQSKLFTKVDARHRIFRARPVRLDRPLLELDMDGAATQRDHAAVQKTPAIASEETISRRAMRIMESHAPAYIVIDDHHEMVHFSGRTGKYLQPTPGAATLDLFNILEISLRPDVRTALDRAIATGQRTVQEHAYLMANGNAQLLNVIVEPVPAAEDGQRYFVVAFQELGAARPRESVRPRPAGDGALDDTITNLETELFATRERLQATIEELETANEEMKAANEEFQAVNEELQCSNEELETSKEELQSVNEELETVNTELNSKIESLDRAMNDRKNLLESTQIATIFLDNELRIKSFTPAITGIFHLIESDYGRPVTHITSRLAYGDLERDVRRVLRTLSRAEQEVALADGSASFLMRILPYRRLDNVIDGVVITFIDMTERKRGEESLARLAAEVDQHVKNAFAAVQAIATRSLRGGTSLEEFRDSFEGRLHALATVHDLLAASLWQGADLGDIVTTALAPYGEAERLLLRGDKFMLKASAALILGMAFHELAVSAGKHGAFAREQGRLEVTWDKTTDGRLVIRWIEQGGSGAEGAARGSGFGLTLIERGVGDDLQGKVTIEFPETGLRCILDIPIGEAQAPS